MRSLAPPLLAAGVAAGARAAAGPLIEGLAHGGGPGTGVRAFSYYATGVALLCMEGRSLLKELRTLRQAVGKGGFTGNGP